MYIHMRCTYQMKAHFFIHIVCKYGVISLNIRETTEVRTTHPVFDPTLALIRNEQVCDLNKRS